MQASPISKKTQFLVRATGLIGMLTMAFLSFNNLGRLDDVMPIIIGVGMTMMLVAGLLIFRDIKPKLMIGTLVPTADGGSAVPLLAASAPLDGFANDKEQPNVIDPKLVLYPDRIETKAAASATYAYSDIRLVDVEDEAGAIKMILSYRSTNRSFHASLNRKLAADVIARLKTQGCLLSERAAKLLV